MKFEIGDIALIKKTGEEVVVMKHIDEEMVQVKLNDTLFPVYIDELETPYLKWFMEQRAADAKKKSNNKNAIATKEKSDAPKGFHLAFTPFYHYDGFEDVVDYIKVDFINQMPYTIELEYLYQPKISDFYSKKETVFAFGRIELHDIPFAEINQIPTFNILLQQSSQKHLDKELKERINIKPKKLFEYILQVQKSLKPSFYITIAKDFAVKDNGAVINTSFQINTSKIRETPHQKSKSVKEIDLHIEQLVPHVSGLNNFEILTIQLNALQDALDNAINSQQQSMIIIHGVGKGKLKEEVQAVLRSNYNVDFFIYDWMPRYGYGATEVFFKI